MPQDRSLRNILQNGWMRSQKNFWQRPRKKRGVEMHVWQEQGRSSWRKQEVKTGEKGEKRRKCMSHVDSKWMSIMKKTRKWRQKCVVYKVKVLSVNFGKKMRSRKLQTRPNTQCILFSLSFARQGPNWENSQNKITASSIKEKCVWEMVKRDSEKGGMAKRIERSPSDTSWR